MIFVLFQEVRNVHERIRLDSFRDRGQKRRIEPAKRGVILECDLIRIIRHSLFWRLE